MKSFLLNMHPMTAFVLLCFTLGCGQSRESVAVLKDTKLVSGDTEATSTPIPARSQIDARFEKRLLAIANEYRDQYRVVADGLQWSPAMCLAPPLSLSQSQADAPHGQKLYYPYAKFADAYTDNGNSLQPIGQVIVKEAWIAKQIDEKKLQENGSLTALKRDGMGYVPGNPVGLFIMFKEEPGSPATDDGWVYGTVTPDHKQVTSAGRVTSCMECHRDAKPDRVFGVKEQTARKAKDD